MESLSEFENKADLKLAIDRIAANGVAGSASHAFAGLRGITLRLFQAVQQTNQSACHLRAEYHARWPGAGFIRSLEAPTCTFIDRPRDTGRFLSRNGGESY